MSAEFQSVRWAGFERPSHRGRLARAPSDRFPIGRRLAVILLAALAACRGAGEEQASRVLPRGVKPIWDLAKAHRQTTPTRERICINGLWRWQPAREEAAGVPADRWGYFKVPGCWPGITDYMQKDCQIVYAHPSWKGERLASVTAAWYQREIAIPKHWAGRRIGLSVEYLNSYAAVYLDSTKAGEIRFPGGQVDLTPRCRPGGNHLLSLFVVAMPLKGVMLSYTDTAAARTVKGSVPRRGLCGDVFLESTPAGPRLGDLRIDTSVRRGEITLDAALEDLAPGAAYVLRARIAQEGRPVRELASKPFDGSALRGGRIAWTEKWMPDRLWDLHTPENLYELTVWLLDGLGKLLDASLPERFGFREFWIEGRDFYLNGTRVFLSAVPLDHAQLGAAQATYQAAKEGLLRLKGFGINFVYTHNYDCRPGSHLSFAEILRAADDAGMLVALSQPHFSDYDWKAPDADRNNGYARHAAFYVRAAQNHPAVVAYAMSHNATGYHEDMNPDMIDGIHAPRDQWAQNNARLARRAEAIVRGLDPSRIVYHHASGNLGAMHTSNFYPNFVPIQEMCDWFEHWATEGVKPLFTCEFAAPFTWDWTMYRGWYQGQREFGSARVPWEFCVAEWNAQFLGDQAFRLSEPEKANLRWEARQFRAGNLWHRWDYPYEVGSPRFEERYPVIAMYLTDTWRALRTWGVSAISPWEYGHYWRLRDGVDRSRRELSVDWEDLQRPGFSPDFLGPQYERMDLAYERSDWIATPAAEALLRNNMPLLAYLAGKPARFTSKDHNFLPGETVEKQLIVLNNSRQTVACDCQWSLDLPQPLAGATQVIVPTGQQQRIPLRFPLPGGLPAGSYGLRMTARFSTGQTQTDLLRIHVLAPPPPLALSGKIALFDPKGETAAWLDRAGCRYRRIEAAGEPAGDEILVIGKAAMTPSGPAPDLRPVRDGLKAIVFEQTAETLQERLGFRVAEYGLRRVFGRVSDHPVLAGLGAEHLCDWRGEATILPPRLRYELRPLHGPTVQWCGIPVTRLWRSSNYGNVASVLIEKPARGDFLPILDGGFSLQYSPLLVYREGRGLVLFCQMDLTGRTETDPAAHRLARNLLQWVAAWKPGPSRTALYVGDPAGKSHLQKAGVPVAAYGGGKPAGGQVLLVGPGAAGQLAPHRAELAEWLDSGGHLLAMGCDERDAGALPLRVSIKRGEHIAAWFEPFPADSPLAGIGPADVHCRDPRSLPLVAAGAEIIGNGVLALGAQRRAVFCQLVPWEFGPSEQFNLRRTYRRACFTLARLIAGMGIASSTPLLSRFGAPVPAGQSERRWLNGLYLDEPIEWDDPYRFFRW